jgi:hypothetical protein
LVDVEQDGDLIHNVSYGDMKLQNIKLGAETIKDEYIYSREIIFNFFYHKEISLTNTDAAVNTSQSNSLGGSAGLSGGPVSGTVTYSHSWSNIKVGAKFAKGDKLIQEYAIEVKAKYTGALWQSKSNTIEETFSTSMGTDQSHLQFEISNSIHHGLTIEQINSIRL